MMNDGVLGVFNRESPPLFPADSGLTKPSQKEQTLHTLVSLAKLLHASETCYNKASWATHTNDTLAFLLECREKRSELAGEISILATSLADSSSKEQEQVSHLHDEQGGRAFSRGGEVEIIDECLICDELLLGEYEHAAGQELLPQAAHLVTQQKQMVSHSIELLQQYRDNAHLLR